MHRLRAGGMRVRLAVLGLIGATLVPVGGTAGAAECGGRITTTRDGWRRVAGPSFGNGNDQVRAFAVAPHDPRVLLVTSGAEILRSADGGCRWSSAYALDDSLEGVALRPAGSILDVVAARRFSYALVDDAVAPRVLASTDGGRSWVRTAFQGVHPAGVALTPKLVTSLDGAHVYVLLGARGDVSVDLLYASDDGGGSWTARPVAAGYVAEPNVVVRDIGVDPLDGGSLWASTSSGVLQSLDGGASWHLRETTERGADLGPISVTHRPGAPLQVLAGSVHENVAYVRGNGGGLTVVNTPARVESLVGGRLATDAAIETSQGVYELDFFDLTWVPAHRTAPRLSRLTTDYTAAPRIYACACAEFGDDDADGSIWSRVPRSFGPDREPPPAAEFPGDEGCAPSKRAATPAAFEPTAVEPGANEVTLQPGQSTTVSYRFRVRPRELDVYFLYDAGYRAANFACAASQGGVWAAQHLSRVRNLRAGLGLYRSYPAGTELPALIISPQCVLGRYKPFVYRRALPVGPVGTPLQVAMSEYDSTVCQRGRAALTALLQAATGEGQDVPPAGSSPFDVPGNLDATFAPDALKVIVHVGGGTFGTPERNTGFLGPTFARTIEALVAKDVKQVAISVPLGNAKYHGDEVSDFTEDPASGLRDLTRVAQETGTLAQRPAHCGPKLDAVVRVGQPLVCVFTDDAGVDPAAPPMGSQMVELVKSLADVRPMRLGVLSGDAAVADLSPAAPKNLDHLVPQTLTYSVTYRCRPSEAGEVKEVELGGEVGGEVVARATTVVRCGVPVPPARRLPDFTPLAGPAVPLVAPAVPQLPPNNVAPNTAPQPNVQSQNVAQGAAAGAAVPQEEAQPRLAYADLREQRPQYGEELEMSALPRRMPYEVPPWMVVEVALLTSAAGAYAARRRTALQHRVRVQRF